MSNKETLINIDITISGPGLIVNLPTALIYKALQRANYHVELPDFDGQNKLESVDSWVDELTLHNITNNHDKGAKINLIVKPLPWGG